MNCQEHIPLSIMPLIIAVTVLLFFVIVKCAISIYEDFKELKK